MGLPPILLDFPDSFETERLVVRAPRPGDGPAVNAAIVESITELREWMPWARARPSVEDTEAHVRESAAHWLLRTDLSVILVLKADGRIAGGSGLHRMDWDARRFEIGYWCRTSLSGQGLVTEAVRGLSTFAFDHLEARRIEIRCDERNVRSVRTARLAGFEHEATLRCDSLGADGKPRTTLVFTRLRSA